MRIAKGNRRFVNVYRIIEFNNDEDNNVTVVGTYEAPDYKSAKVAFEQIKNDEQFKDPSFSVQIQDYDANFLATRITRMGKECV